MSNPLFRLPASCRARLLGLGDRYVQPLRLRAAGVRFGRGLRCLGRPVVRCTAGAEIVLGEDVKLASRATANPLYLSRPCVLEALKDGARIVIGDGSGLSGATIIAYASVEIGRQVLLGAGAYLVDTDFHPLSAARRAEHPTDGAAVRPIRVGDGAFIGMNALVLKGVTIGEGAVVGAGAVVTRDVPAGMIAAGNPAKLVGEVRDG
jgi:acetyltransferase-like isoleucine patch superfamily enzyme